MKVVIEVNLNPEVLALLRELIEVLKDLTTVVAPLTGYRIAKERKK